MMSCLSHPTWVRGLKLVLNTDEDGKQEEVSHPTWVRGLKLKLNGWLIMFTSRTLRGCVD